MILLGMLRADCCSVRSSDRVDELSTLVAFLSRIVSEVAIFRQLSRYDYEPTCANCWRVGHTNRRIIAETLIIKRG